MTATSPPLSAGLPAWRPWLVLSALSLLLFLVMAATYSSLGVVLPAMVREEHWSWGEAGLGFTLLGAACGGSSYLPALLIRRVGVRATLLIGTAVMSAGFACLFAVQGLWLYFAGAALCGVGYQMMALIPGTHVLAAIFPRRRAFAIGLYFTLGGLGGVAGPWMVMAVTGAASDRWRLYWAVMAGVALAVGAACALVVGHTRGLAALEAAPAPDAQTAAAAPAREGWSVADALRTPQFWIIVAAYFCHLLSAVTVASLSVAHLTERGVTAPTAGAMLSLEALMATGGRVLGGLVGDHVDPKRLLLLSLAALVGGCAALAFAHGGLSLWLYAAGTGAGFGLTALATTLLLLNYYGRERNLELFSIMCLAGAASALGPFAGGLVRDATGHFGPAFLAIAGVIAVVFAAALPMRPPRRVPAQANEPRRAGAFDPGLSGDPA